MWETKEMPGAGVEEGGALQRLRVPWGWLVRVQRGATLGFAKYDTEGVTFVFDPFHTWKW